MTSELLDLINILGRCVALEPCQNELLRQIAEGPQIKVEDLSIAGVLPAPLAAKSPPKPSVGPDLFSTG
jgi:hypothetical protein